MQDLEVTLSEEFESEWEAWRRWCKEFERVTGNDIDDSQFSDLVNCIKAWGEELVALRRIQSDEIHPRVLAEFKEQTQHLPFR